MPTRSHLIRLIIITIGITILLLLTQTELCSHLATVISSAAYKLADERMPPSWSLLFTLVAPALVPVLVLTVVVLLFGVPISPYLRHPIERIIALDQEKPTWLQAPYGCWFGLSISSACGLCLYALSLSAVHGLFLFSSLGFVVQLAWYCSWIGLFVLLFQFCKSDPIKLIHACLVSMTYGVAIALIAMFVNVVPLLGIFIGFKLNFGAPIIQCVNVVFLCASNLVMCWALTRQLSAMGIPAKKVVLAWVAANGLLICYLLLLMRSPLFVTWGLQG